MSEVIKVSKKGVKYSESVVANVSNLVPTTAKGKFLIFDNKTGNLVTRVVVKKTEEEKQAKKSEKLQELKQKWSVQVDTNKEVTRKIERLQKENKSIRQEAKEAFKEMDVEKLKRLKDELVENSLEMDALRHQKKVVPQAYI